MVQPTKCLILTYVSHRLKKKNRFFDNSGSIKSTAVHIIIYWKVKTKLPGKFSLHFYRGFPFSVNISSSLGQGSFIRDLSDVRTEERTTLRLMKK